MKLEHTIDQFDILYEQCKHVLFSRQEIIDIYTNVERLYVIYARMVSLIWGITTISSSFYSPELAGGILILSTKNMKKMNRFLERNDCTVIYNDMDMVYFSPPLYIFNEIDKQYYSGKLEKSKYSTALIKLTREYTITIHPEINAHFLTTSPTSFLQLDRGSVRWPSLWVSKNKYTVYNYENNEELYDSPRLISFGLYRRMHNSSSFIKKIYNEILHKILSLENQYTVLEVCKKVLLESYIRSYAQEDFVKLGVYHPDKKNISAHTFNMRMKARDEKNELLGNPTKLSPIPYHTYDYVFVKKSPYDHKGRKILSRRGDRMEYLDYAIKHKLEIDMNYYVKNELVDILSILISHDSQFYTPPVDENNLESCIAEEQRTIKHARKYIRDILGCIVKF